MNIKSTVVQTKPIAKPKLEVFYATLLSFIFPGAGQVFNGQVRKGIVAVLGLFLFYVLFFKLALINKQYFILGALLVFLFWLMILGDAVICARKNGKAGEKKRVSIPTFLIFFLFYFSTKAIVSYKNNLEFNTIESGNMFPTLKQGEKVVSELDAYEKQSPNRGDIVVFEYPKDRSFIYIKRIVGIPGDSVEIKDTVLYVNDKAVPHVPVSPTLAGKIQKMAKQLPERAYDSLSYYRESFDGVSYTIAIDPSVTQPSGNFGKVIVPTDQYFVLGDNRDFSNDSRYWGFLPKSMIRGKYRYILTMANEIGE